MKTGDMEKNQKPPRKVKPPGADGHRKRMIARLLNSKVGAVPPRDLLEILLYYTIRVRDTRDTAVYLMQEFDNDISRVLNASTRELTRVSGVGPASAEFFHVVGKIVEYLNTPEEDTRKCYTDISDIGELFSQQHQQNHHDSFWIAYFDNAMHLISMKKIKDDKMFIDDNNLLFPIIMDISKCHCSSIAVARLSGDCSCYPTSNDFEMLKRIEEMALLAHVVLREYFIASPDESIGIKDMYI